MHRATWDEAYAERYDEWSAHMTADIPFYVGLAQEADGPANADGVRVDSPVPHTVRYDAVDNRLDIVMDSGATSSLWWATRNEWLGLIDVSGLKLQSLFGGFAGEPLTEESREYVFVARRPERAAS